MRPIFMAAVACLMAGCVENDATSQVAIDDQAKTSFFTERDGNEALAASRQITWAEYAARTNASLERLGAARLNDQDRAIMAYRAALSADIDAGRVTPDAAKLMFKEKERALETGESQ